MRVPESLNLFDFFHIPAPTTIRLTPIMPPTKIMVPKLDESNRLKDRGIPGIVSQISMYAFFNTSEPPTAKGILNLKTFNRIELNINIKPTTKLYIKEKSFKNCWLIYSKGLNNIV